MHESEQWKATDVKYRFSGLLAICISPWEKLLLRSFAQFKTGLSVYCWNVYYHLKMIRTSLTVHAFTEGSGSILAGKESTCDAGDTGSWVRKIHWRRHRLLTPVFLGFPGGSEGKESACNAGDLGSIPGLERSPGEANSYHSSILAWRIPWTVWPIRLQTVGHNWTNYFHFQWNWDPPSCVVQPKIIIIKK